MPLFINLLISSLYYDNLVNKHYQALSPLNDINALCDKDSLGIALRNSTESHAIIIVALSQ